MNHPVSHCFCWDANFRLDEQCNALGRSKAFDQTAEFLAVFQSNVRGVYEHQVNRIIQGGTDRLLGASRRKYLRAAILQEHLARFQEPAIVIQNQDSRSIHEPYLTIFLRKPGLTGRRCCLDLFTA